MVAVIKTGHSIHHIFNYNENKVKEGAAQCIAAENYPKDLEDLTLSNKLNRLLHQAALNQNAKRNSVHISLNFDPSERLDREQLQQIADAYMQGIGFGEQPYLVYQHQDAGHPHIHIVSIKVKADGSCIDLFNIGRNQSEKARKEIEKEFGLVKAEDMKMKQPYELKPTYTQKVQYGKAESRKAIAKVLEAVVNTYKYTSLPELNAVLRQYNVLADRCEKGSRVYEHNGLLYRILDEQGNPIGVPIKASSFYNKPTLKYLESRFEANEAVRQQHKARVKNAIDFALLKPPQSLEQLIKTLEKDGINTIIRQNEDGIIYGLTYVDHRTKCVFNGSALGKPYSAKGILERCGEGKEKAAQQQEFVQQSAFKTLHPKQGTTAPPSYPNKEDASLLETLLQPENGSGYVPGELMKKGKRRRKRRTSKRL